MFNNYNIYYLILKSIRKYANFNKVYINTNLENYINNIIGITNLTIPIKNPYHLEVSFKNYFLNKVKKYNFLKEVYLIHNICDDNMDIKLFDKSYINIYFFKKSVFNNNYIRFCKKAMFYDSLYGYNEETNKSSVFCEVIECDISKLLYLNKWDNIFKHFCKTINLNIIPHSISEPINTTIIHWNKNIKVICIINAYGFYLLELFVK